MYPIEFTGPISPEATAKFEEIQKKKKLIAALELQISLMETDYRNMVPPCKVVIDKRVTCPHSDCTNRLNLKGLLINVTNQCPKCGKPYIVKAIPTGNSFDLKVYRG